MKQEQLQQPFFAQFLDAQKTSDQDKQWATNPLKDQAQTHKYPSDGDDNPPEAEA